MSQAWRGPRGRRWATILVLGSMVVAAASTAAADDWFELKTPHFTVLSESSESKTTAWAIEFEQFRRAMLGLMPVDPAALEPVTMVLFRSDRRLRPFKPMEHGKPSNVAGFFTRAAGRNVIAMSIEGARDDVRELVFHEAVHWHLAASERPRPLWLEEGLAQLFGNFRVSGEQYTVGGLRPEAVRYVNVAKPLPFVKMMEVSNVEYNGKHRDLAELFYHQSWLMAHALFFGAEGIGLAPLADFVCKPAVERNPVRDLERGLGIAAAQMDECVQAYLARGRFRSLTMKFDRSDVQRGFVLKPAPAAEVDLVLGNVLIGAGRAAEAEPYLWRAHGARPGDARVLDALGGMNLALSRKEDAIQKYEEAVRAGSVNYVTEYILGQHELQQSQQVMFGTPDTTAAVQHFLRALQLNPRYVPAYESLALAAVLLPQRSPEAERLMDAAATKYPANPKIQAGVAFLATKYGDRAKAHAAAERAGQLLNDIRDNNPRPPP